MYRIPDIRTSYCPQKQNFDDANREVHEYADKLAKNMVIPIMIYGVTRCVAGSGILR